MQRQHYSRYDDNRAGWCVFKKDNELISQFHAGPFETKQHADSEAERLNDLMEKEN